MLLRANFARPAEAAHRFAHANGQIGNGLEALHASFGKRAALKPARFGEKEFGVAENAGERIVQFAAQQLAEVFL